MKTIIRRLKQLYNSGAFHITIGTFITKFVGFFGSIFVVRILSKADYGLLQYVENLYSYAIVFAGFGLPLAILRYVIIATKESKKAYLNYAITHSLVRDFCICLIIIVINFFIHYPEGFQEAKYFIPILAVLIPFENLVTNGLNSMRAIFKNKEYAYASCIISILLIAGRIVGAKIADVDGVIWSRLVTNILCAVILTMIVYRLFPYPKVNDLSAEEKRDVNIYSLQYMIINGLWALFMLNDTLLLGLITNDPTIVADYKVAYVLPANLSLISTAIGIYIAPYFTKNEDDVSWIRKNYKITFFINAVAVGSIAVVFFVLAEPLISFIYGISYVNTVPLMRILLFSSFLNSGLRYVTANLLSAMGKVGSNLVVSSIGLILQIIFDIVLIPQYGALGVGYASCVVFGVMSISLFYIFYRMYYR